MRMLFAIALSIALPAFNAVQAADQAAEPVKATTRDAFESVARDVRGEMADGGRYAYIKPDERTKIESGLAEMSALFEKSGSVEQMNGEQKIALFNAQEKVNSILALRDRDRLICERGALTGARIVSTSCHTYGEIEASRQASQKLMQEKVAAPPCISKPCGG